MDVAGGGAPPARSTLTGVTVGVDVTAAEKVWRTFQALGDIAFAYAFSTVLIEIQVRFMKSVRLLVIFSYMISS